METLQLQTSLEADVLGPSGSTLGSKLLWSHDGNKLISIPRNEGEIQVWDESAQEIIDSFPTDTAVDVSRDTTKLAIGREDGDIQIIDISTSELLADFRHHSSRVWSVVWSPDMSKLASFSEDGALYIWDSNSGEILNDINVYKEYSVTFALDLAWSPDGTALAGATMEGIYVWDSDTGQEQFSSYVERPLEFAHSRIGWSPSGNVLTISGGAMDFDNWYGKIWYWDAESYQLLLELDYRRPSPQIIWSSDENMVATTNSDGTVNIWETSQLIEPH
jgi:WD40 repeat protein